MTSDPFAGFDAKFRDFPDYIIAITKEIWEDRGIGTLNRYYAPDVVIRSPMGIVQGNQRVIASTMATNHEFSDRELFADDVIWSNDPDYGLLSSHRVITRATHLAAGQFGAPTNRRFRIAVVADCAARDNVIYDEWLVRDYGGIVRQLGLEPAAYARDLIALEGGLDQASPCYHPDRDVDGGYHGRGNYNEWGARYAELLTGLMAHDFAVVNAAYDRAVMGTYAGANNVLGRDGVIAAWLSLRAAFPDAEFRVHHQIGMDGGSMPPRAAVRWSLDGTHTGWGAFGKPSGAQVHIMGIAHCEFGPWGVRRETGLWDEIAIWKQIAMHRG